MLNKRMKDSRILCNVQSFFYTHEFFILGFADSR